jgi:hypothetical protein
MDGDLRSLILKSDCRLLVTLQWDHIDISIWYVHLVYPLWNSALEKLFNRKTNDNYQNRPKNF